MTVWARIGVDEPFKVKGGRVWWDYAHYDAGRNGRMVRLDRIVTTGRGLRILHRYVSPDTEVSEVQTDGGMCCEE